MVTELMAYRIVTGNVSGNGVLPLLIQNTTKSPLNHKFVCTEADAAVGWAVTPLVRTCLDFTRFDYLNVNLQTRHQPPCRYNNTSNQLT